MINCPYCGKLTDPRLNACPHCHAPMRRGAGQSGEVLPANMATQRPAALCPTCRTPVKQGDIICVKCGTNLLTGQQVVEQVQEVAGSASGALWRMALVVVLLLIVAGGAGGAYFALVYNEPVTKAKRLASQGNMLEAVNTLDTYTQKHKDNAEALALQGEYQFRSQRYADALAALGAAAKLRPADAELNYRVAAVAARVPGSALNDQIAAFRRITENHPDDLAAAYLLALALGAGGQYAESAEVLDKIVAAPASPETANAPRYLGIAKALNGDVPTAAALVAASPEGQEKALAQGLLANMQGDSESAVTALQAGLQGGTPAIQALAGTQLGLLLMRDGKSEAALPVLREASGAPQAPPAAAFFYALCLQNAGLEQEAMAEFGQLAQGSGEYAADAAAQLAEIYLKLENPTKAEESLRQATAGGKKSAKIYTLQGALAAQSGDNVTAQQSFRMAMQLEPDYAPAHLEMGLSQIAMQRLPDGVAELKKYLELAGDAKEARAPEITLLVNQLEQTIEKAGGPPGPQAAGEGRATEKESRS